jgi:hypothetical protein
MGLLISMVIGLGLMEFYSWLPRVCEWIVELAVRLLPPEHRDRWRQEFQYSQNALPQTVWRLVNALSLCWGAVRISYCLAVADLEEDLERSYAKFDEINSTHRTLLLKVDECATMIGLSRRTYLTQISTLTANAFDLTAQASRPPVVALGSSLRQFAETLGNAHDRATAIFAEQISARWKQIAEITPLLNQTSRDWAYVRKAWSVARFVPFLGPAAVGYLLRVRPITSC